MAQVVNNLPLYVLGNEYTSITGGYSSSGYSYGSGYSVTEGTKNADNLYNKSTSRMDMKTLGTTNPINTEGYTKIYWKGYESGNSSCIALASAKNSMSGATRYFQSSGVVNSIKKADITAKQGTFYPVIFSWASEHIYTYALWIVKEDDISGLKDYGSTISEILTNSRELLDDKNAIEYMVNNCTGDFMSEALASSEFKYGITTSSYKYLIYENSEWKKYISLISMDIPSYQINGQVNPANSGTINNLGIYYHDDIVSLNATSYPNYIFTSWSENGSIVSTSNPYEFYASKNRNLIANFASTWSITTNVVGDGTIAYNRQTSDYNTIQFYVTPGQNRHFTKYVFTVRELIPSELLTQNGAVLTTQNDDELEGRTWQDVTFEIYETPYTITLESDCTAVAYFEEDPKYTLTAITNVLGASVYISNSYDYAGYESTLRARPFSGYLFSHWSDGSSENPHNIIVNSDTTLEAIYDPLFKSNENYQFRCYVKDQMHLTDPPKSYMVVKSFTIREDILTTANSEIKILKIDNEINNGDILVLYDPRGFVLYQGVITKINSPTKNIKDNYDISDEYSIECSQMQTFYAGKFIYKQYPQTYLESEIKALMQDYADGKIDGSDYVDPIIDQRLSGITINSVNSTQVNLPTLDDMTVMDMEDFIYSLYEDYELIFEFDINDRGSNSVTIKKPNWDPIKIGNNTYAVRDMSPVKEIEDTNKLIIFGSDKTYRATWVATPSGIFDVTDDPGDRFNITNTEIVTSDDDIADIVAANLPSNMYNHKVTFSLRLDNSLYDWKNFHLGMNLQLYINEEYFDTILTGWEIEKEENKNIKKIKMTCGKVRTSLTNKLTMGVF